MAFLHRYRHGVQHLDPSSTEHFDDDLRGVTNSGSYSFTSALQCARTVGQACPTPTSVSVPSTWASWPGAPTTRSVRSEESALGGQRVRILELVLQHRGDGGCGIDDQFLIEQACPVGPAFGHRQAVTQ